MKPSKESPHHAPAESWADDFQPPVPFIPVSDSEYRLDRAQILMEALKKDRWPGKRKLYMRGEDLAAVLMVAREELENDGSLSRDTKSLFPFSETETFEAIAHFGIHYMLHVDPNNLEDARWQNAIPELMEEQPEFGEELYYEGGLEAMDKAWKYRSRFQTAEYLQPVRRSRSTVKAEEAKCQSRDKGRCVVTGKPLPQVFWFIPFTWNDTVDHMNATGQDFCGCLHLAGVNLMDGLTPPCSVRKLGGSHKAWNMLCVDLDLQRYLKDGLCAFKWLTNDPTPNGEVRVTLQFHWMPILERRCGLKMNIDRRGKRNDLRKLVEDIRNFNQGPHVTHKYGTVMDKYGKPLRSGYLIYITMPKQDAEQCRDAVKVHWACVVYTALCGAAGKPWLLAAEAEDQSTEWVD
ncbi:unnamed protein product [Fusarium equiseti]|uniref:HNH nuclease domain-containing protein n=1 Tax=Fusarium equiseti TaxID=61235 RepID=A0A8J2J3M0_FUSEQ|nr:unnamed protein product [Fusarium equiseti]